MANLVVLIQFLAADEEDQPNEDKTLVLVDWVVEDVIYLICRLADCSWKMRLD
jgi:hypothetical protein